MGQYHEGGCTVTDLLFWFLVAQTIAGLPAMDTGTEVWVMSEDLFSKYATAVVIERELWFQGELTPNTEVKLLIYLPNPSNQARVEALAEANQLRGMISPDGNDIWVQFAELDGPLSFKKWLSEERGIRLVMPSAMQSGGDEVGQP